MLQHYLEEVINMSELFIPQAQDMVTPAMNLYKLMQQKKEFELEQQKQGSLQDYHKQMGLQNKIQNIISLAKDQPKAAEQMFNSDHEMVQRNQGPIKFKGTEGDWHVYEGGDAVYKIDRKSGKMVKAKADDTDITPKIKENVTQYLYQDENGKYRIGLFDESGTLKKDQGEAPEKMVKSATTSQTVNIKQETEEAKAIGKGLGEKFIKAGEDADSAVSQLDSLDRVESLLQGVDTGRLTPLGTEIAGYAKSLGIDIDPKSGNKEAAQSLVNQFVLQLRNPASGAGMPGQLSDSDRKFLQSMGPGIEKTPEGRRQIIETMRKVAGRRIEYADQMQEYRKENDTLAGFDAKWRTYVNKNPLFKDIKIVPTPEEAAEALRKRGIR